MIRLALLCAALAAMLAAPAGAGDVRTGRFVVKGWGGPAIPVYYAEPSEPAGAPVVLVMHGVNRNADDYRDNWIEIVRARGFAVYAPEFSDRAFPGAVSYNLGGAESERRQAFRALKPILEEVRRTRGADGPAVLFGHSAGAQFVHRWLLLRNDVEFDLLVAANAGWYTMPDFETPWPYGLKDAPAVDAAGLERALAAPLLVFLGDRDADPNASNLRKTRGRTASPADGPSTKRAGTRRTRAARPSAGPSASCAASRTTTPPWRPPLRR